MGKTRKTAPQPPSADLTPQPSKPPTPTGGSPLIDPVERYKFHTATLERIIGFTRVADIKAAPILALQAALPGLLLAHTRQLLVLATDLRSRLTPHLVWGLLAIWSLSALLAWIYAARVYIPMTPPAGGSLIYFEDIRRMDAADFRARGSRLTAEEVEQALLDQIWRVSRIASVKLAYIRISFVVGAIALVSWAVLLGWVTATTPYK